MIAHINVNWLSPVKVRTTLIGGEKKMLVWNDLDADEKIKVYDKGVDITKREGVYDLLVSYRSGDMWAPQLGADRGLGGGDSLLCGVYLEESAAVQRRASRPASSGDPGSGRQVSERARQAGISYEQPTCASLPT